MPRLVLLRILLIYKKFYRNIQRSAELITSVELIERVVSGGEDPAVIVDCSTLAEDWNGLIRSCGDRVQGAAFMIDCCDMFFSLNELQKQIM